MTLFTANSGQEKFKKLLQSFGRWVEVKNFQIIQKFRVSSRVHTTDDRHIDYHFPRGCYNVD